MGGLRHLTRTPDSYFDALYHAAEDPWDLAASWYETRKYAVTLASLPERRYRSAFEPGCSVGVLTASLAARCDRLLACDHQPTAVQAAQRRLGAIEGADHITVERRRIPEEWPAGAFDLLVLSEVCYYFDRGELAQLLDVAEPTLAPGATVVAVHWRGRTDYPLTGDEANRAVGTMAGLAPVAHHEEPAFVLDVWHHDG